MRMSVTSIDPPAPPPPDWSNQKAFLKTPLDIAQHSLKDISAPIHLSITNDRTTGTRGARHWMRGEPTTRIWWYAFCASGTSLRGANM